MTINTRTLAADAPGAIAAALDVLRVGGLVVFPTDTVYGVGCDPWNPAAIARLYEAKARPLSLAIPVLVASPTDVATVAANLPSEFAPAAARFWPGALTLIVPRNATVPDVLCAGKDSIAVRMPDHPVALELLRRAGGALAVTSANRSGEATTATAEDAREDLAGRVELILDGGRCPGGTASTIIDLTTAPPRLLRAGALALVALRAAWPHLEE